MNNNKWTVILSILLTITLLMSGCQDSPAEQDETNEEMTTEIEINPEDSGPLRLAVTRPDNLNPLFNANQSLTQLYHLVYEGLVTFNENREIEPLLASDWEWNEAGQSITFTLRDGVKWHDGEDLTPDDVIFTINMMKDQLNRLEYPFVHADIINQISDVRSIDDNQVQVSFSRPFSNGLEALVFPVLPQHIFSGSGSSILNSEDFTIVGTGPYKVIDYDKSRSFELNYFHEYWGDSPYIQEIFVSVVPDREAAMSMFESGEIDLVEPLAIDWTKHTDRDEITGKSFLSNQYEFLGVNFENEWLSQKELRQAIAYAINREEILEQLYFNNGVVTDTPVFPDSWLNQLDQNKYSFDPAQAEELIGELEIPEGTTFSLLTNEDNQLRVATAQIIADYLRNAGLEVDIEEVEWENMQERTAEGNFDMVLTGWHLSVLPDLSFAFHSSQLDRGNFIRYQNEKMDEVIETIFAAADQSRKQEGWLDFQDLFIDEMPYISLFYKDHAVLHRETLRGELKPHGYNIFEGIETAYIVVTEEE
ncbi:MAG: peptide ABC transporter substrate-binding protein [Tindallia sp. MSAO_Bac2]|nr:MAG: peptide ABC transporter substrate-binding protein [Tindallia sp. MSAO_Bac2]